MYGLDSFKCPLRSSIREMGKAICEGREGQNSVLNFRLPTCDLHFLPLTSLLAFTILLQNSNALGITIRYLGYQEAR